MGRHIHPSRRALPFTEWPITDQAAWNRAIADGDILDGRGPAAHWAARTKETNQQHYGRWLGFLAWQDRLLQTQEPADRATPDEIRAYLAHLETIVAPRTVLSMTVGIKVCLQAMAPACSWRWLQDVCNRIQRSAKPVTDKRLKIRDSAEIYRAALKELAQLSRLELNLKTAIGFRDALMLALLAARPIRVKNMTSIQLKRHLLKSGDRWLLVFPAAETKNRQHLEYFWPEDLMRELEAYLARFRLVFPGATSSDQLWLNQYGPKLGSEFVYSRIIKLTRRLFGVPINPHLLRDCAASSLAIESSDAARSAAALLGHRYFSTTERYYIQANNLEASRRLNGILSDLKHSLKEST